MIRQCLKYQSAKQKKFKRVKTALFPSPKLPRSKDQKPTLEKTPITPI